jgi:hypothetical protein
MSDITDLPEDIPTDIPEDTSTDTPVDNPTDTPVENPEDNPTDTPEDNPEDIPEDIPEDTPEDIPEKTPEYIVEMIVETGDCVEGANSYVDLTFANQFMTNHGRKEWLALDEEIKKTTLIKATTYVDNLFTWKGLKSSQEQALSFPRTNISDLDGFEVLGIPIKLKQAICEAAYYGFSEELFSTYDANGAVKKHTLRQKASVVEEEESTEYFSSAEIEVENISKYAALNSLLKGLYKSKSDRASVNASVRWGRGEFLW